MDLSSIKSQDTTAVEILHPASGAPVGITVTVASMDSERARAVEKTQRNARIQKLTRGGRRNAALTADELEKDGLDLLVHCTVSWDGVTENGQALECTPENVRRVYTSYPWLREQVDQAVADRANFFKA